MQQSSALTALDSAERRQGERFVTLLRISKIERKSGEEFCVLRNLSVQGAKADVVEPFHVNEEVSLTLRWGESVAARVAWVKDTSIGLGFHQPIEIDAILANARSDDKRTCGPRINILAEGKMLLGSKCHDILVENLSLKGARILGGFQVDAGTAVCLDLEGIGVIPAVVSWSDQSIAGLAFNHIIPVWVMMRWIKAQCRADISPGLTSGAEDSLTKSFLRQIRK